jgi:hypothetical protein
MFDPTRRGQHRVLPLVCPTCPYKVNGRCDGPFDNKTYLMQDPSLVSCIDIERRGLFFDELHGRLRPIPRSSFQDRIVLPPFIPGVKGGLRLSGVSPNTLFAVSYKEILGRGGTLVVETLDDVRRKMGLPGDARVALIGTAQDDQLEALWHVARKERVWERIASIGFEFVTSCTFSVWDQSPRFDQIRNQERNLLTHDLFVSLGVPSIPFLFPFDESDYRAAFEWLTERPDINKIAVLAQYYRRRYQFAQLLNNMRKLQEGVGKPVEFLVVGAAGLGKIRAVLSEFDATILTWKPFQAATAGLRSTENLHHPSDDVLRLGMKREELAGYNIERYRRRCEELRGGLCSAA